MQKIPAETQLELLDAKLTPFKLTINVEAGERGHRLVETISGGGMSYIDLASINGTYRKKPCGELALSTDSANANYLNKSDTSVISDLSENTEFSV